MLLGGPVYKLDHILAGEAAGTVYDQVVPIHSSEIFRFFQHYCDHDRLI